jgi:hypothetical protein
MNLKYELQSIISGAGRDSKANLIEAAAYYLRQSEEAGGDTQGNEFSKDQEAANVA